MLSNFYADACFHCKFCVVLPSTNDFMIAVFVINKNQEIFLFSVMCHHFWK